MYAVIGAGPIGLATARVLREIAAILGKPLLVLPTALLRSALAAGRILGVSRYGPAQLDFLRYQFFAWHAWHAWVAGSRVRG